jgi:hypothetical protein
VANFTAKGEETKGKKRRKKKKKGKGSLQHLLFPGGHPSKY